MPVEQTLLRLLYMERTVDWTCVGEFPFAGGVVDAASVTLPVRSGTHGMLSGACLQVRQKRDRVHMAALACGVHRLLLGGGRGEQKRRAR